MREDGWWVDGICLQCVGRTLAGICVSVCEAPSCLYLECTWPAVAWAWGVGSDDASAWGLSNPFLRAGTIEAPIIIKSMTALVRCHYDYGDEG
jgi:hypothetical protein